jgi:hypothetical protein
MRALAHQGEDAVDYRPVPALGLGGGDQRRRAASYGRPGASIHMVDIGAATMRSLNS